MFTIFALGVITMVITLATFTAGCPFSSNTAGPAPLRAG